MLFALAFASALPVASGEPSGLADTPLGWPDSSSLSGAGSSDREASTGAPWARRLAVLAGQVLWQAADGPLHASLDAWAQAQEDALLLRGELPRHGVLVYSEPGHGGLGNQVLGLVGALYLAYGSDRLLLVRARGESYCSVL